MTMVSGEPRGLTSDLQPRSVVDLVHRSVERWPGKEAIRWKTSAGWSSWTYAELWGHVAATSVGLRRTWVGAGDRVVILSRSRPEWLVADLACLALGAVTCPIYHGDPPARMGEIVRRVGARLALVEDTKLLQRLRSGLPDPELELRVVLIDPGVTDERPDASLSDLRGEGDLAPEALAQWESTWRAIHPAQVATIVHTMGVDGDPLGVVVSHGNLLHSFQAVVQAIPVSSADRVLSVLPLSHMFERGAGILVPLGVGATVAFAERPIERWAANMAEVHPTLVAAIPIFFQRIAHRIQTDVANGPAYRRALFGWAAHLGRAHYANHVAGRTDGPWHRLQRWVAGRTVLAPIQAAFGGAIRFLVSGGAALPEATGLFFEEVGIPILEGYGLTESAPILTVNRLDSYRYGTVGLAVAGTELRIDPVTGEILARGGQIMLGYLDRPEASARVLDAEGWLHTGDVGEFDEEGRLRITGRIKNLLVLATGNNVAPAPMERAMARSPYISQAVVLGDDRDSTGALLVPDVAALRGWSGLTDADGASDASGPSDADLLARPEVAVLLRAEVDRVTDEFAAFERPRRFVLLPRALSAEAGEIDAAGAPVRSVVIAAFPEQVADLFDEPRAEQHHRHRSG